MIFDALPILSAGGGTKIAGPHVRICCVKFTLSSASLHTLRLEGEGVLTVWGTYDSDKYLMLRPIVSSDNYVNASLEIDGNTYLIAPSQLQTDGVMGDDYIDIVLRASTNTSSPNKFPTAYVFHEYLEVTFTKGSYYETRNYAFQYYDLDADNPVTVTFA